MARTTARKTTRTVSATKNSDCPMGALEAVEIRCPECRGRGFDPARGRFGPVWKCRNKPACKFQLTARPIGKTCSYDREGRRCGRPMVEGTKTIPDRCSDRDCPNRNPHKLEASAKRAFGRRP